MLFNEQTLEGPFISRAAAQSALILFSKRATLIVGTSQEGSKKKAGSEDTEKKAGSEDTKKYAYSNGQRFRVACLDPDCNVSIKFQNIFIFYLLIYCLYTQFVHVTQFHAVYSKNEEGKWRIVATCSDLLHTCDWGGDTVGMRRSYSSVQVLSNPRAKEYLFAAANSAEGVANSSKLLNVGLSHQAALRVHIYSMC